RPVGAGLVSPCEGFRRSGRSILLLYLRQSPNPPGPLPPDRSPHTPSPPNARGKADPGPVPPLLRPTVPNQSDSARRSDRPPPPDRVPVNGELLESRRPPSLHAAGR